MPRSEVVHITILAVGLCIGFHSRATAQVSSPPPAAFSPGATEWKQLDPGSGHPFWMSNRSRPSLLATGMNEPVKTDSQVKPVSFDALPMAPPPTATPIPPTSPTTIAAGAANVTPGPSVAPQPSVAPPSSVAPPPSVAPAAPVAVQPPVAPVEHPSAKVLRWADAALLQMDAIRDYTCTFVKREQIDGRLQEQQVMFVKSRPQPFSVYLQFLSPNNVKGQEAIYVAGANQGKLLAHPVGFKQAIVGTVAIAPDDPQAMENDRYTITDFGLRRLVERYRDLTRFEAQFGDCDVRMIENTRVADRPCTCIQTTHAVRRREFRFHLTRLYVDTELNVPIRFEAYDWPSRADQSPPLVEEYTYQGLRLNVGLTDFDFDAKNPDYRF